MKFAHIFTFVLLSACGLSTAHAQLVIEITRGQEDAVPIAIVPFGWEAAGQPPFDIA